MEQPTFSEVATRELVELIAERLGVGVGRWRLELEFQDGQLARFFRHEGPIPAGALGRFEVDRSAS